MSFTSAAPMPRPRTRWSDLYVSAVAQFFTAFGTFLVMVTLVLALQRRGAGGLEVGALVLCEALPMVVFGKFIGNIVDRVDSRVLMIVAGVGQVTAGIFLAEADGLTAILIGATALATASGIALPTRQALLASIVHRDDLPRANAIGQTAGSLGMMLGPAAAGLLVSGLGPQQTVRLAALGFAVPIIAAFVIRTRRGGRPQQSTADTPASTWSLAGDRLLWSATWSLAAVVAAIGAVNVVLVFFIIRTLSGSEATFGLVDSTWTIGVLIGAWAYSRVVRPATGDEVVAKWLFLTLGLVSVAVIGVGLTQQAWWVIPCYLVGGANNGGLNVLAGTLIGRRTPAEARGRANTALAVRVQAGAMLGYVAGGLLLEVAEPRTIVLGCGALGLVTTIATTVLVRIGVAGAPARQEPHAEIPG
jgi:MFS family permease